MLTIRYPTKVKCICGLIYTNQDILQQTLKLLSEQYGNIDFISDELAFDHTNYYCPEMGKPLFRKFIAFESLRNPDEGVELKLFCIKQEKRFAIDDKRRINIDPGYISEAKLVLTTTKNYAHRIYLQKGIFAEVTLIFRDGAFQNLATTFPDYRTPEYKAIFTAIRGIYRKQILTT